MTPQEDLGTGANETFTLRNVKYLQLLNYPLLMFK